MDGVTTAHAHMEISLVRNFLDPLSHLKGKSLRKVGITYLSPPPPLPFLLIIHFTASAKYVNQKQIIIIWKCNYLNPNPATSKLNPLSAPSNQNSIQTNTGSENFHLSFSFSPHTSWISLQFFIHPSKSQWRLGIPSNNENKKILIFVVCSNRSLITLEHNGDCIGMLRLRDHDDGENWAGNWSDLTSSG